MSVNEVVSFRIPKELKKKMRGVDVNWSEEIRNFIERRVKEHRREMKLRR